MKRQSVNQVEEDQFLHALATVAGIALLQGTGAFFGYFTRPLNRSLAWLATREPGAKTMTRL